MSHEPTFRISITPFYPPLASCQLYRADITYQKIYQGYVDFCHSEQENEFKGVRQRNEKNQWTHVDDWYPSFAAYLYSIRNHIFDVRYGKENYSIDDLRCAMEQEWNTLDKKCEPLPLFMEDK